MGYFVADNVDNNDTCIDDLSIEFGFDPLHCRLHCMGYVINLVAYTLLFGVDLSALDKEEENLNEVLR